MLTLTKKARARVVSAKNGKLAVVDQKNDRNTLKQKMM